jgi:two-component system, chemotaxis family, chemotaxis protein CheY
MNATDSCSQRTGGAVRVRITQSLSGASVDGIDLSRYLEGLTYDVGTTLGNYLLAQQWATPVPDEEPATTLPLRHTLYRPSILILEDDVDMQLILAELLHHHGWLSHVAGDGEAGLEALKTHRPSLILLDLAMPRMNGEQFRTAQQQLPDRRLANIPVVVVSAAHDAPSYKTRLNASAVLVKPFDADHLLHAVESHARPASLFRW